MSIAIKLPTVTPCIIFPKTTSKTDFFNQGKTYMVIGHSRPNDQTFLMRTPITLKFGAPSDQIARMCYINNKIQTICNIPIKYLKNPETRKLTFMTNNTFEGQTISPGCLCFDYNISFLDDDIRLRHFGIITGPIDNKYIPSTDSMMFHNNNIIPKAQCKRLRLSQIIDHILIHAHHNNILPQHIIIAVLTCGHEKQLPTILQPLLTQNIFHKMSTINIYNPTYTLSNTESFPLVIKTFIELITYKPHSIGAYNKHTLKIINNLLHPPYAFSYRFIINTILSKFKAMPFTPKDTIEYIIFNNFMSIISFLDDYPLLIMGNQSTINALLTCSTPSDFITIYYFCLKYNLL